MACIPFSKILENFDNQWYNDMCSTRNYSFVIFIESNTLSHDALSKHSNDVNNKVA